MKRRKFEYSRMKCEFPDWIRNLALWLKENSSENFIKSYAGTNKFYWKLTLDNVEYINVLQNIVAPAVTNGIAKYVETEDNLSPMDKRDELRKYVVKFMRFSENCSIPEFKAAHQEYTKILEELNKLDK